jgi:hypothetical protein
MRISVVSLLFGTLIVMGCASRPPATAYAPKRFQDPSCEAAKAHPTEENFNKRFQCAKQAELAEQGTVLSQWDGP